MGAYIQPVEGVDAFRIHAALKFMRYTMETSVKDNAMGDMTKITKREIKEIKRLENIFKKACDKVRNASNARGEEVLKHGL